MSLSINPRVRLQQHIEYLKEHIEIGDENDQKNFDHVYGNFCTVAAKLRLYQWVRNIVAVFLYASVITTMAKTIIPGITWALSPLVAVSGLVGITVLSALWIGLNTLINTVMLDLVSEHSHLVAILVKNNDEFVAHPGYSLGLFKKYT